MPNIKGNEILNNHRPISSYLRNINTDTNKKDLIEDSKYLNSNEKNKQENNNYANFSNNNQNNYNSPQNQNLDHKEIMERFNNFIIKNKLTKEDFIESEDIFVSKEDFKDLFKRIRFEITKDELNFLFSYNNSYSSNDFIRMKSFLEFYQLDWVYFQTEKIQNEFNMKKIDEEFKNLHGEILDIIRKDMIQSERNDINKSKFKKNPKIKKNKCKEKSKLTNLQNLFNDKNKNFNVNKNNGNFNKNINKITEGINFFKF